MTKFFQKMNNKNKSVNEKRLVRSIINQVAEKKIFITGAVNQATAANGTVLAVTQGIIQGDTVATRDGSQITCQTVGFRVDCVVEAPATVAGVRVLLVGDTMNDGSLPAVTDVLNASTLVSPYSTLQQLTKRYVIYKDVVRNLAVGGIQQTMVQWVSQINKKITYKGVDDQAASNGKNSLYFIILTDSAANQPRYDVSWCVNFLDM